MAAAFDDLRFVNDLVAQDLMAAAFDDLRLVNDLVAQDLMAAGLSMILDSIQLLDY